MNVERDGLDELLARAERGFERDSIVLAGDDERVARIERAVQRRHGAKTATRTKQVLLAVAVGLLLTGAALGALRVAGLLDGAKSGGASGDVKAPSAPASSGLVTGVLKPRVDAAEADSAALPIPPALPGSVPAPGGSAAAAVSVKPVPGKGSVPNATLVAPSETPASLPVAPADAAAKRFDDAPAGDDASETAATLFAAANRARVSGNVSQAVTLSRRLLVKFPRSPEAVSTHLSLGMLELQQGHAAQALTQFEAYEQQGSGSAQAEALWGKAQALQRLGRTTEERAALGELLARYPRAAYAAAAQKRLSALP